jgi:hypothetical protein
VSGEWRAIEYVLDPGDGDDWESGMWGVTVAWRGPGDLWAVLRGCYTSGHHYCFDADGGMESEHIPSERTEEWKAKYRFPLAEAMAIGERVVASLVVNGMTWEQVVAWRAGGHQRDDKGRPIIPGATS